MKEYDKNALCHQHNLTQRWATVLGFYSHHVQNGSEAYPASYPMGDRGSFLGGRAAGAWNWPLTSI
jgi:hypothetical protein